MSDSNKCSECKSTSNDISIDCSDCNKKVCYECQENNKVEPFCAECGDKECPYCTLLHCVYCPTTYCDLCAEELNYKCFACDLDIRKETLHELKTKSKKKK